MPSPIRHDFHTDIANTLLSDIQYQQSNYYYFLGKIDTWGVGDVPPSDGTDSDYQNNLIRSNILYINKIGSNDVSIVTKRHDWVSGTVYTSYDNTIDLRGTNFYVMTDDFNVYKCLSNNGGAVSTSKPEGTSYYSVTSPDGYIWKYMYTIPSFKRSRFVSVKYIPVQNALTNSFYSKGAIEQVSVVNGGSGYVSTPITTVTVTGPRVGSGGAGTVTTNLTGTITGFTLTDGGTGYASGVRLSVDSVTGSGAVLIPVITGGVVTSITIESGGVGYASGSDIVFSTAPAILVPAVSSDGSIVSVKIIDGGTGYAAAPSLLVATTGTGFSGKYGNATALISPVIYGGEVVGVNILDPGVGYSADPSTTITVQGNGNGAAFTPVLYNGQLVDVVIDSAGDGYTDVILSVNGIGSGAVLKATMSTSDFISNQSVVEQTTVAGGIYSIPVLVSGNNYSSNVVATLVGDGTGCTITPIVSNGEIRSIRVNTFGQDYTYGTITFTDVGREVFTNNTDAVARVVISPNGGHGSNAVSELFGDTLAITSSLRQDSSLNKLFQDYRQFGLIKNPTDILTNRRITAESSLVAHVVTFSYVTDLVIDEILLFGDVKFRVVGIDTTLVTLQQMGSKYVEPVGELIAESESTRVYSGLNIVSYPTVNKYTGKLLYSSNENPFSFTEEQGITIKTFLQF